MKLKTFMGMEVAGAYQRYLDRQSAKPETKKQTKPTPISISNPDSYLILQSRKGDYPDFPVNMHRLSYDPNVEVIAKKLNLSLENTANEQDGTGYIGKINHEQALTINRELGNFTLPLLYFTDLLYNLMEGIKGKQVYDANGTKIDARILESMFNEITEVRSPWRSEYLDGKFGNNTITYHKFVNGKFTEVTEELDDCLMENKTPGIDLEDWLKNPTSQGLPRKNCKAGNLYYWGPVNGRVAGFGADSDRAYLSCYGGLQYSDAGFGVRAARAKI